MPLPGYELAISCFIFYNNKLFKLTNPFEAITGAILVNYKKMLRTF